MATRAVNSEGSVHDVGRRHDRPDGVDVEAAGAGVVRAVSDHHDADDARQHLLGQCAKYKKPRVGQIGAVARF